MENFYGNERMWFYADNFLYDYRYADMRALEVIPSIKLVGLLMFNWGLVLEKKEER